ncbi:hypothetical protein C5Y96_07170 [Blastopirellula marina]|uniref:Uncharacterized protein n=1 Tax=Blastopirellula marina TaxID=124 RepID=A0A2S8FXM4_9BACT|nr:MULTISPECIES: hypothetical protein [Pirellulaceae]PQO36936.1 hypothetical protein C5Y96_07170 [Blastopirellula marina]RCS53651.1 hypothetical protein DTL36_07180 [Bremerella cremea]
MTQSPLIVGLSILMCVIYGVIHDQITARICVEYFTIGHKPVLGGTEDPTLLGLVWGFLATWWVGAMLGIPLAFVSQTGSLVKKSAKDLVRPMLVLMAGTAALAFAAGVTSYVLTANDVIHLAGGFQHVMPAEKQDAFLIDLWIHNASYAGGFLGGVILMVWVVVDRYRQTHWPKDEAEPQK